jgi:hypothetical protein
MPGTNLAASDARRRSRRAAVPVRTRGRSARSDTARKGGSDVWPWHLLSRLQRSDSVALSTPYVRTCLQAGRADRSV